MWFFIVNKIDEMKMLIYSRKICFCSQINEIWIRLLIFKQSTYYNDKIVYSQK